MKAGIHPTQVEERIKNHLNNNDVKYDRITYLDWLDNNLVEVTLDNKEKFTFDYINNVIV